MKTDSRGRLRCSAWLGGSLRASQPWSWCKRIDLSSKWAVEIALTMSQWMTGVNWLATRNWVKDGNMVFVNFFVGPLRFGVERTMPPNDPGERIAADKK